MKKIGQILILPLIMLIAFDKINATEKCFDLNAYKKKCTTVTKKLEIGRLELKKLEKVDSLCYLRIFGKKPENALPIFFYTFFKEETNYLAFITITVEGNSRIANLVTVDTCGKLINEEILASVSEGDAFGGDTETKGEFINDTTYAYTEIDYGYPSTTPKKREKIKTIKINNLGKIEIEEKEK